MAELECFTDAEKARLADFLARHDLDLLRGKTPHRENVLRHTFKACKWWRRGIGMIVPGKWVEGPSIVMLRIADRTMSKP